VKVRTEARRDHILEIASQVFLESGFERASMSEIARRVGGSKATLYGYFTSKEALFLAFIRAQGQLHLTVAETDLALYAASDLGRVLTNFGIALISFTCSTTGLAVLRTVIAEAGQSDIGRLFYETGPKQGLRKMAEALRIAMDHEVLRQVDPMIAAQHLFGLFNSEIQERWFDRDALPLSEEETKSIAERAVDVFLRAYGADGLDFRPGNN